MLLGRRHVAKSVDVEGGRVLRSGGEAPPLSRAPRHHVRRRLRPLSGPRRGQRGERRQTAAAAGDGWSRGTIAESRILVMASAGGTTGIVSPPVGKGNSDTLGFAYTVATVYKTTGYKMNLDIREFLIWN